MLRRCLVGLFALHFLLSLGGFTLHLPVPGLTESALTADEDGLDSRIQHGLTDDAPDMPDGPVRRTQLVGLQPEPPPTPGWGAQSRAGPPPVGPERPPRRDARA